MRLLNTLLLSIFMSFTSSFVQATSHEPNATLIEGEVRKVDKDAKKLTIRHGPIANLEMPAMTMVFQVKDPAILDQVKAGDKVRFMVEKSGGAYIVTHLESTK